MHRMKVLLSVYASPPLGTVTMNSVRSYSFFLYNSHRHISVHFIYLFTKNALMHILGAAISFLNELYIMDTFPSKCIEISHSFPYFL